MNIWGFSNFVYIIIPNTSIRNTMNQNKVLIFYNFTILRFSTNFTQSIFYTEISMSTYFNF
jgi:hypothetical protein